MPLPQASPSPTQRRALRGRLTVYRTPALPQSSVRAILQDRRGYLWFGTEEGIVQFDGMALKPYRIADGLVYNFVQAIAEDRAGCLWIGTRMGLSRFDPIHLRRNAWHSFTTANGLPDVDVRAIATGDDGTLWLATRGGLAHLDPGTLRFAPFPAGPAGTEDVSAVFCDSRGNIWAGSKRHGVGRLDPASRRWTSFDIPSTDVTSIAEDGSGAIWIGTHDRGVIRLAPDTGAWIAITTDDGLSDNKVLHLMCDRRNDLWVSTETAGVARASLQRSPGVPRWSFLSVEDGLADFMTFCVLEDRSGVYWIGSLAGLTSYAPEGTYAGKTWTTFTREDGLAHSLVAAVAQDSSGRYWFGTYGRGVTVLTIHEDDRLWETYDSASGLSNDIVRAIAEDGRGRIWFGTFGGGLSRFDPRSREWRTVGVKDGLAGNAVRTIRADTQGRFWVGTDGGGISLFDPNADDLCFTTFAMADGLPSNRVSSILHDRAGRVWVGTYEGGLALLENGAWSIISKENGLPANDIYCMAEDPAGRIWIGTGSRGLVCCDGDAWRFFNEEDGLPNNTIYQVLVESEHSIYGSTNRGVFRLRLDVAGEVIIAFDGTDGLGDNECNGGASLHDRDGRFWFGTVGGVSFIDPREVPERIPPCLAYITGLVVHDEAMDLDAVGQIEDSKVEFLFHYGAVEYVSPHKVRYRTHLDGFDQAWSKVTTERQIRYTNLRPGHYTFQVQARNWGGEWSHAAELAFDVVPDPERIARAEAIEKERIEKKVLETAHTKLQQLAAELHLAYEKLREKELLLEMQAREDALTAVLNRRYLDIHVQQEFDRAVRFRRPFSIVMSDLDHFKSVNDRFSHAVGDDVLRIAARLMRTSVRSVDIVARYGGEEFAILLPETNREAALVVCEKIRAAIAGYPWGDLAPGLAVTASFGCSDDTAAGSPAEILHAADQKLFEAKRQGRNRVCG